MAVSGCSIGLHVLVCAKRDRAKELSNVVGKAVLEPCHTVLPVSLAASQGAVVPPGKTQHSWCKGQ